MKAFRRLLVADFKQFFRDRTAVFFTFAFPIFFMLIFGLVFSGEEEVNYSIGLVKEEESVAASMITEALKNVPIFDFSEGTLDDMLEALRSGDLRAVVVIPQDIAASLHEQQATDIILYYDQTQTTSAQILLPVMRQVINEINRQMTQQPVLLNLAEESIQSHNLRIIDYMVPGIVAMSVLFLGLFGGLPLVEWREKKILKRLGAAPLNRATVIYSQITYRLVLSLLQAAIIIVIARFAFNVQVVGNWFLLLGILLLGTMTFISIGYLAVSRARTTEGAMPIIQVLQFPMMFLSGIFFPVEMMPDFMRPILEAIPLTYLGDGLRQIMVDATPLYSMPVNFMVLGAWLVVSMILTIRLFSWE